MNRWWLILVACLPVRTQKATVECSPGFFSQHGGCYHHGISLDFHTCRLYCKSLNSDIASLETCSEHEGLADYFLFNTNEAFVRVGGIGNTENKQWTWASGSPLPLGPPVWAPGEPNQNTNSLVMSRSYNYKFIDVSQGSSFICLCEESLMRRNMTLVLEDKNPVEPFSENRSPHCPAPYTSLQGLCILFYKKKGNWKAARDFCIKEGGDLVTLSSCEDHGTIVRRIKSLEEDDAPHWVGAKGALNFYEWVSGQPVKLGPSLWQPGYPVAGEGCVWLSNLSFYGMDADCSSAAYAICQYKPQEVF